MRLSRNPLFRAGIRLRAWVTVVAALTHVAQANDAQALEMQVATLNVFDLPEALFHVQSAERMRLLPEALAQSLPLGELDAIVFTEAYVAAHRDHVALALSDEGFRYRTELPRQHWWDNLRLPGILLVSRWPIERVDAECFADACAGADCFAVKGAVFASLRKTDNGHVQRVHVVGTHFYLGKKGQYRESRLQQARALTNFVSRQGVGLYEPVIVAGDLNASWTGDGPALQAVLGAARVAPSGPLDYTFVGDSHPLGGSPWQSAKSRCEKIRAHKEPTVAAGRKWVDYVWAIAPGAKPSFASLRVVPLSGPPYALGRDALGPCLTDALSDHHAVVGRLIFPGATP